MLAAELTNFYEYAMCGKRLSLLKELAPSVARVAVLQNPDHPSWAGYRQSIATAAPSLGAARPRVWCTGASRSFGLVGSVGVKVAAGLAGRLDPTCLLRTLSLDHRWK